MLKERDLGRKVLKAGLRVGGAALLAGQMSFGMDRVARADINEPVRYPVADGRLLADAPLRTAGRAVDFTGPHGLEFCGTSTTEPTVLTVIANENAMNIKVVGNPDVFVDPVEADGIDYPSRAASAVEALMSKGTELINRTNRLWRRIAVILTRDAVNQNVCDLITDSGAFAAEAAPQVPAAVPNLGAAAFSEPTILRCGLSTLVSSAATELKSVGYPGPFDIASLQAAINRTIRCGGVPILVGATQAPLGCPDTSAWGRDGLFRVAGIPLSVNAASIDFAKSERGFNGLPTQPSLFKAFLATPGLVLFGEQNQQRMEGSPFRGRIPAFGYGEFIGEEMTLNVNGDRCIQVDLFQQGSGQSQNTTLLFAKGRQIPGQDRTGEVTNYSSGNALYKRYPDGAFVEPRQVEQQVDDILRSGTPNCQGRGCETATLVLVDLNTKAFLIAQVGKNRIWSVLGSNFSGF